MQNDEGIGRKSRWMRWLLPLAAIGLVATAFLIWRGSRFEAGSEAYESHWPHVVKVGSSCGLIDRNGNYVVNPRFDGINALSGNLYPVSENGRWGVIDPTGKYIVEPKYDFATVLPSLGSPPSVHIVQDERWGLADANGMVIEPRFANPIVFDRGGMALVWTARAPGPIRGREDIGSAGIINREGATVISSPDWISIIPTGSGGFAVGDRSEKYRLVDRRGQPITSDSYDDLTPFDASGIAAFSRNGKWGLINARGEQVREPVFENIGGFGFGRSPGPPFDDRGAAPARMDGRWGFIDRSGEWVIQPQFGHAQKFAGENLTVVEVGDRRQGVIDRKGRYILNPSFENIGSLAGPLIPVGNSEGPNGAFQRWGFADKSGRVVVEPQYVGFALPRRGKRLIAVNSGKLTVASSTSFSDPAGRIMMYSQASEARWGFIDETGRMAIAPIYEDAWPFDESGLAGVKQNGRWGFIDETGKIVIRPQFDAIECRQRPAERTPRR